MIAAIIQARTGSTRLPNKIFSKIIDKPFIWHVVNRLTFSQRIQKIIIATTANPNDNIIEKWAVENDIAVYRGSENDVLDRYLRAAELFDCKTIIRITADDPFKDPELIDSVVKFYEDNLLDFAYNNFPPSFPEGLDTEVFSFDALKKAACEARDPFEREHVTQYFYRNKDLFKQANWSYNKDISHLRWTVDNKEDLDMAIEVYKSLYSPGQIFLLNDILNLLIKRPELKEMNSNCERSALYRKKQ